MVGIKRVVRRVKLARGAKRTWNSQVGKGTSHRARTVRRLVPGLASDIHRSGKERQVYIDKKGRIVSVAQGSRHKVSAKEKDIPKISKYGHTSIHTHPVGHSSNYYPSEADISEMYSTRVEREAYIVHRNGTVSMWRRPTGERATPEKKREAKRHAKNAQRAMTDKSYERNLKKLARTMGATYRTARPFARLKKASPTRRRSAVRR